jgi:hypothetical protein
MQSTTAYYISRTHPLLLVFRRYKLSKSIFKRLAGFINAKRPRNFYESRGLLFVSAF